MEGRLLQAMGAIAQRVVYISAVQALTVVSSPCPWDQCDSGLKCVPSHRGTFLGKTMILRVSEKTRYENEICLGHVLDDCPK